MLTPTGGERVRVLVTNDDGIDSPGLHALARVAVDAGHEVVIAAPAREASGSGASLSALDEQGRMVVHRRTLPGLGDVEAFAVEASPAYIALVATRGGFGPAPALVLSGINLGANTGVAVLHSGTVGAAFTGAANGCHAMAVSLDIGLNPDGPPRWESAAATAAELLPLAAAVPHGVVLNVNVPNRAPAELRGVRRATLATFGVVQLTMHERGQGFVKMSLEQRTGDLEPGSDEAELLAGYVTITPIRPTCEAVDVSLPGTSASESVGGER
jgi:5'-nucleotidase